MKVGICNLATDAGRYLRMQERLLFSLKAVGFDGDIYAYNSEKEISPDCPLHSDVPYGFKPYAMQNAIQDGCDIVIWMDAAIYATKPIDGFINQIKNHGYVIFKSLGYSIGDYTSDTCLDYYGWDRARAFSYPMSMACLQGINVHNKKAKQWFDEYFEAAQREMPYMGDWFNGENQVSQDPRVKGHRHDQSCASIICAELGMDMTDGHTSHFAYVSLKDKLPISETVSLWSEGL
jgi:hypothetical protein